MVLVLRSQAQVLDKTMHVDTLSMAERISLHTNAIDWLMMTPNIGIEYDIKNVNWNKWSVGLNLRYNWQTKHTYKPGIVYNLAEARLDVKNYWRNKKHPTLTVYYKGVYAGYAKYSLMLGKEGKQGSVAHAGVMAGMIKPLHIYQNGNSIDLELSAGIGVGFTQYDKYTYDAESNCYPTTGKEGWQLIKMPIVSDMRVGLIYRFGNYPSNKKYRNRYDADAAFRTTMDSISSARKAQAFQDSLNTEQYNEIYNYYKHIYDSICGVTTTHAEATQAKGLFSSYADESMSPKDRKKAEKKAEQDRKKAAKQAEKERHEKEKADKKAAKAAAATKEDSAPDKAAKAEAKEEEEKK